MGQIAADEAAAIMDTHKRQRENVQIVESKVIVDDDDDYDNLVS